MGSARTCSHVPNAGRSAPAASSRRPTQGLPGTAGSDLMDVDAWEAGGGLGADATMDLDAFSCCRWAVFSRAALLASVSTRPD